MERVRCRCKGMKNNWNVQIKIEEKESDGHTWLHIVFNSVEVKYVTKTEKTRTKLK